MSEQTKAQKPVSSKPIITQTAKDFLRNPKESSRYIKAANETLSAMMVAVEAKIDQKTKKPS